MIIRSSLVSVWYYSIFWKHCRNKIVLIEFNQITKKWIENKIPTLEFVKRLSKKNIYKPNFLLSFFLSIYDLFCYIIDCICFWLIQRLSFTLWYIRNFCTIFNMYIFFYYFITNHIFSKQIVIYSFFHCLVFESPWLKFINCVPGLLGHNSCKPYLWHASRVLPVQLGIWIRNPYA